MKENKTRRKLLLGITGVAGLSQTPLVWKKPVVESVMLPVHAAATAGGGDPSGGATTAAPQTFNYSGFDLTQTPAVSVVPTAPPSQERLADSVLNVIAPTAFAGPPTTSAPTTVPPPVTKPPVGGRSNTDWNVAVNGNQAATTFRNNRDSTVFSGTLTIGGGASVLLASVDSCGSANSRTASVVAHNPGVNITIQVQGGNATWQVTVPLGPFATFIPTSCA